MSDEEQAPSPGEREIPGPGEEIVSAGKAGPFSYIPGADAPDVPRALQDAFRGLRRALVLTHDNPDPDGLAAAFTLRRILEEITDLEIVVAYSGLVGRAENRAMLRVLELDPVPLDAIEAREFQGIALVDTQPGSGNNSLPPGLPLIAVIDHHPSKRDIADVPFVDVREHYGATSTMIHEYTRLCDIELSHRLATALFYAIRSETQDLGREAEEADRRAYFELLPDADVRALARIQRARVPREYFRVFRVAIDQAEVFGRTVFSDLGRVPAPDMVAEIADFLLRLQGIDWACAMGRHDGELVLSLRTSDPDAHAGRVIREVVAGFGTAGGHGMMAGGQVSLEARDYDQTMTALRDRLLERLGGHGRPGEPLVLG